MLQLEYICTDAEKREARTLDLRREFGKGSRVRTLIVLSVILTSLLALGYFQMRDTVAPKYRPWVMAGTVVIFFFFYFQQLRGRKGPGKPIKIELTDRDVTILSDGLRVSTSWSGFSQCLESPNLFVLLDRPKGLLLILPKRVFPDESKQSWFRTQANQRSNAVTSTVVAPFLPDPPLATNGIVLNFQLGYRDYMNLTMTSWRTRGIALLLYGLMTGFYLFSLLHPEPNAVNSPAKVYFVFSLPMVTVMLAGVIPLIAFMQWRSHSRYLEPRRVVLSSERIELADRDASGFIPWTTYQYYQESRRAFLVWHRRSRQWDMFPKRAFTSALEMERCRELLQRQLNRSRWFFL